MHFKHNFEKVKIWSDFDPPPLKLKNFNFLVFFLMKASLNVLRYSLSVCCHSPIQKRTATTSPGTSQASPQMVEVRYQVKKGSQQIRKVPITTPSVTKALCSFRHDEFTRFRSFKARKLSVQ